MRLLPEHKSVSPAEIAQVVNELVRLIGYADPSLNDRIGQAEPEARDLRSGRIAYADGVNWNPGSGKGIYWYTGTVWKLISAA